LEDRNLGHTKRKGYAIFQKTIADDMM